MIMRNAFILFLIIVTLPNADAWGAPKKYGYTWKACTSKDETTSPIDALGYVLDKCTPDVLYSWLSKDQLLKLSNDSSKEHLLPQKATYTWKTPIGSFGYGDSLLRIKLRKGVRFKQIPHLNRNCSELQKQYDLSQTVFVIKLFDSYSEFLICGDASIHSWSFGTKEILEEVDKELKWIKRHSSKNFDMFVRFGSRMPWEIGTFLDGMPFSKKQLTENINTLTSFVNEGTGTIHFANNVISNPFDHYSTKFPGYFNYLKEN
jgi:hypothetical protein